MSRSDKPARDNRANQLNPNNDAYWQSRGEPERPTAPTPDAATPPPAPAAPGEKGGRSQ